MKVIQEDNLVEKKVSITEYKYSMLQSIVMHQINMGEKEEEGHKFRWLIPAMAFSAFYLEALANAFGNSLFDNWEDYEPLPVKNKVRIISEKLQIDVKDFSIRPWQIVTEMHKFRNELVHLKPRKISEVQKLRKLDNGRFMGIMYPNTNNRKKHSVDQYSIEEAKKFFQATECIHRLWSHQCLSLGLTHPVMLARPKIEENE